MATKKKSTTKVLSAPKPSKAKSEKTKTPKTSNFKSTKDEMYNLDMRMRKITQDSTRQSKIDSQLWLNRNRSQKDRAAWEKRLAESGR